MMDVILHFVIDYYCIGVITPNLQHRFVLISCTNQCHSLKYDENYKQWSEGTRQKI